MSRVCLYFVSREPDRWVPGDRYLRPFVRRLIRGRPKVLGVERVFVNLRQGLEKLGVPVEVNLPFSRLRPEDRVGVLGRGVDCLAGYDQPNPVVAGIGVMTHPAEAPDFCERYPVAFYVQHSQWVLDLFRPYFGERCRLWPCGVDTEGWRPASAPKSVDMLLYDKVLWDYERRSAQLLEPIRRELRRRGLSFTEIRYGRYGLEDYRRALRECKAMLFVCEHESQGLAYQECLASGVPVLAWDQGWWLDPNRFRWGTPEVPATSVPFWDERCGLTFASAQDFGERLGAFLELAASGRLDPRAYVLENLSLETSARRFLELLTEASRP